MSEPLFSIIVPTYNRGELMLSTLQSLVDQDFNEYEILVIDDGSSDNTDHLVSEFTKLYPQVKFYKITNRERGAARNFGAKNAKGRFLNFFDSDDLAYTNHLSIASKIISDNKDIEVFATSYDILNQEGKLLKTKILQKTVADFIYKGNDLSCNGVFVKKEILLNNPFSENRALSASEDYELWLRLSARYTFPCFTTISHAVVHHPNQSTLNFNPTPLIERKMLMLKLAFEDKKVSQIFGDKRNQMSFSAFSYIALHIALSGNHKMLATHFLFKSLIAFPRGLFTKRTMATAKHIIFKRKTK